MTIEPDAIRKYYPEATKKMADKPFYAHYLTYLAWQTFVKTHSGEGHWGYNSRHTAIFNPISNVFMGMIGIMYHNSPMEQTYVVTFTPPSGAHDQVNLGNRPPQAYYLKDSDMAYALMIAIAYPNMAMWESILKGDDKTTAIKNYVDMVPSWCNFTKEQEAQFVKNLVI